MMKYLTLTVLFSLVSVGCSDLSNTNSVPRYERVQCRFDMPADLGNEGADYSCADLTVWADRAAPQDSKQTLRLHLIRFFSDDSREDVNLYFHGGPGSTTNGFLAALTPEALALYLSAGDLVVLDQRGVSQSVPALDCDIGIGTAGFRDPSTGERWTQCQAAYRDQGIDLTAFNTEASADDIADLIDTLGGEQVGLYGISYGTRLALEVLRRHENKIRAVVLDSPVPTQVSWDIETASNGLEALFRLVQACAQDTACNDAFPGLSDTVFAGLAELSAAPLDLDSAQLTAIDYASILVSDMYDREYYPDLPLFIQAVADRDPATVLTYLAARQQGSGEREDDRSAGMHYAFICNDLMQYTSAADIDMVCGDLPPLIDSICVDFAAYLTIMCAEIPAKPATQDLFSPVIAAIPTLIMVGEMDPVTPPRYAELAAEGLSRVRIVEFPATGHSIVASTSCGLSATMAFLHNPEADLDLGCVEDLAIDFTIPSASER